LRSPALYAAILAAASLATAQNGTFTRLSATVIGQPQTIEYTSTVGNSYTVFLSGSATGSTTVPGIGGTLLLHLGTLITLPLYSGTVPAGGVHSVTFPVPNDPAAVGSCLAMQAVDVTPPSTFNFSTNAPTFCFLAGVGNFLIAEGTSTSPTAGNLVLESVSGPTAGAPTSLGLGAYAPLRIRHFGREGFRPLVNATFTTTQMAEQHVDSGKEVSRDMRDPDVQNIKCPNGFDLYVMRNAANTKETYLLSVQRATSIARELTGSRVTDLGATAPATGSYLDCFAFNDDGSVAMAIVHDSTNAPTPNVGPADRIVLIKTDFNQTWSNGMNVIDVSPVASPDKLHTAYNNSQRFGNGWGFVEGEDPDGVSGAAALWAGLLDGSPWVRLPVPLTGTLKPFIFSYSQWRQTADGKTGIFLSGGNATSSTQDMDYMSITGIDPSMTPVVTNITGFATSTQLQTAGQSGIGANNLRAALSPNGARAAFIIGTNSGVGTGIAIVRTDGSNAGAVAAFTTALFDAQVDTFGELLWLDDNRLLFGAGGTATSFDLYVHDVTGPSTTNLTKTTTGSLSVPFTAGGTTGNVNVQGSFVSDNRKFYYFLRSFTATTDGLTTNLVGIEMATGRLFAVTGVEFGTGICCDLRAVSTTVYTWQFRRHPVTNQMYFIASSDTGNASLRADDQIWRFNPENGSHAVQVTNNTGTASSTANIQRIDDMVIQPSGGLVAYAQGVGTLTTVPEDVFVVPANGLMSASTKLSKTPASGGQGIRRGSVFFTPAPGSGKAGVCWQQGTGSRVTTTANVEALWTTVDGLTPLIRLTAAPVATARQVLILNASQ
jgi:hypothetical protein